MTHDSGSVCWTSNALLGGGSSIVRSRDGLGCRMADRTSARRWVFTDNRRNLSSEANVVP